MAKDVTKEEIAHISSIGSVADRFMSIFGFERLVVGDEASEARTEKRSEVGINFEEERGRKMDNADGLLKVYEARELVRKYRDGDEAFMWSVRAAIDLVKLVASAGFEKVRYIIPNGVNESALRDRIAGLGYAATIVDHGDGSAVFIQW